jgi:hypothetical protein
MNREALDDLKHQIPLTAYLQTPQASAKNGAGQKKRAPQRSKNGCWRQGQGCACHCGGQAQGSTDDSEGPSLPEDESKHGTRAGAQGHPQADDDTTCAVDPPSEYARAPRRVWRSRPWLSPHNPRDPPAEWRRAYPPWTLREQ